MSEAILREPSLCGPAAPAAPVVRPGAARPAVWLARLALSAFRSYREAALETGAGPVVLCGPNGAGKTNLLEAISLLAPGRGLRRARLSEMMRRAPGHETGHETESSGGWAVAARVATPDGLRELGTGREPNTGREGSQEGPRERRAVRIDGAPVRGQQALGEVLALVWLTPQMDGLLREGPGGRRRFLDRLVYGFDPAHAGRVSAYEQSMRERARLLKLGRAEDAWLSAVEDSMARHGTAIAAARRALVARLNAACAAQESAFPVAGLALEGETEAWLDEGPALQAEDRLRARLAAARPDDGETGGTSAGPHRSDLAVRHLAQDMPAALCSTGEQKALLLSIVLAHARLLTLERGAAPILLLDEVAAHLDPARRGALYEELLGLGAQAWLTGTEFPVFAPLGEAAQFVRVENAALTPVPPPAVPPVVSSVAKDGNGTP